MSPSLLPPPLPIPLPPQIHLTISQSLTTHTLTRERGAKVFCLDKILSNIRAMIGERCNMIMVQKIAIAGPGMWVRSASPQSRFLVFKRELHCVSRLSCKSFISCTSFVSYMSCVSCMNCVSYIVLRTSSGATCPPPPLLDWLLWHMVERRDTRVDLTLQPKELVFCLYSSAFSF